MNPEFIHIRTRLLRLVNKYCRYVHHVFIIQKYKLQKVIPSGFTLNFHNNIGSKRFYNKILHKSSTKLMNKTLEFYNKELPIIKCAITTYRDKINSNHPTLFESVNLQIERKIVSLNKNLCKRHFRKFRRDGINFETVLNSIKNDRAAITSNSNRSKFKGSSDVLNNCLSDFLSNKTQTTPTSTVISRPCITAKTSGFHTFKSAGNIAQAHSPSVVVKSNNDSTYLSAYSSCSIASVSNDVYSSLQSIPAKSNVKILSAGKSPLSCSNTNFSSNVTSLNTYYTPGKPAKG